MANRQRREQTEKSARNEKKGDSSGPRKIEWVLGAVSALLVIGLIGFIVRDALRSGPSGPQLSLVIERIVPMQRLFRVEFRALNAGDATAAEVRVQGTLGSAAGIIEVTEVTLDYVPAQSSATGGLLFKNDPARYRLELTPRGYRAP